MSAVDNIIDRDEITLVGTGADVKRNADVSHDLADKLLYLIDNLHGLEGRRSTDLIVVFEEWALNYPNELEPISDSRLLFVGQVEDYSADAYRLRGAFNLDLDGLEEADDEDIAANPRSFLEAVDETDTDFIREKRMKFAPKSAVRALLAIE